MILYDYILKHYEQTLKGELPDLEVNITVKGDPIDIKTTIRALMKREDLFEDVLNMTVMHDLRIPYPVNHIHFILCKTPLILPCPFCGGDAELYEKLRMDGPCHYMAKFVRCKNCGARTKEFTVDGYYGEEPHPDNEIIGFWNNRV